MKKIIVLILLISSFNTIAQKADVRVEIFDLKEDVKKLQSENQRLSNDLSISSTKYENRILDLGAKIEDLKFELNVLKRIVEQYRNSVSDNSNSTSLPKTSTTEENVVEKTVAKPKPQSSSQCSATTKSGTRCSRSARSNGLCWQHGG
jgi:hypothetical protein